VQQGQKRILTLTTREAIYFEYSNNMDREIFPLVRPLSHQTETTGLNQSNTIHSYFPLTPQQILREYFMLNSGC